MQMRICSIHASSLISLECFGNWSAQLSHMIMAMENPIAPTTLSPVTAMLRKAPEDLVLVDEEPDSDVEEAVVTT